MALELIGGASVGALFGELVRAFMELKDNAMMFRSSMEQLEATLKSLAPVIKEIQFYNHELNRPQSEIESLIGVMEGGKKLRCNCKYSRIRRWYDVRRMRYQKKLVALDKSLLRFLNVDLQAQMARDQKQILLLIKSKILGPDHRGHQDVTVSMTVSQIGPTKCFSKSMCSAIALDAVKIQSYNVKWRNSRLRLSHGIRELVGGAVFRELLCLEAHT